MKTTALFLAAALFATTSSFAQNCSKFYPLEEGSSFQYTMYDKKGKPDGTTDYTVTKVSDQGGQTAATMQMQFRDKKGKEILSSDYGFTCTGKGIKIDYNSLMPKGMLNQYEGMEYNITGTDIEVPNDLSVGQTLDDATMSMAVSMAGIKINIDVNMINRKVEKEESVTTPAGTFDCYVIYGDTESKMMGATRVFPNRLWLSEGVGMVKQETYKKDGDLMSSMALTEFNN